jgi:protein-S-isoprenylcysteine O-methyltransferase Ste14
MVAEAKAKTQVLSGCGDLTTRERSGGFYMVSEIFISKNGMNIIGQGGKIMLSTLPFVVVAIAIHTSAPQVASLPAALDFIRPVGYILMLPGIALWLTAVVQLVTEFPKGKLITTGAYGVCRNPIYSSFILFVLPGISILTFTWVYFLAAVFLLVSVLVFIGQEEHELTRVFGEEYANYKSRVDRVVPFVKPFL